MNNGFADPAQIQAIPLGRWMELHPGQVSLLAALSGEGSLGGGIRLLGMQNGDIAVVGRICQNGPESRIAGIQDWAGGYRVTFGIGNGSASLPPIPTEAAAVAAIKALAENFSAKGMPAPLVDFAPGGKMHNPQFSPLLPTNLGVDGGTLKLMIEAATAAAATSVRVAPGALVPDTTFNGLPVFDLRIDPKVRDPFVQASGADPDLLQPLLVRQQGIGGAVHYLLMDGVQGPQAATTWCASPDRMNFEAQVWPKELAATEVAPLFVADRQQAQATRLN